MASGVRRGRPTRAEAEALESRLRDVALAMFLDKGFNGTTMEAVAAAAGISKRTLYSRYPDKHSLFATVVPWALTGLADDGSSVPVDHSSLTESLSGIGRAGIRRAVHPSSVQLRRIAMNEARRFPEFAVSAESMLWSTQLRAVMTVLEHHQQIGTVAIDDIELTAQEFIGMVVVIPGRLADFGIRRTPHEEERHLRHAVATFLNGVRVR